NEIASWLEPGWDDPFHFALVAESREEPQGNGAILTIHFAADPARTGALRRWAVLRDEGARTEKPARQAMQLFETLYSLYGRIDREAERVALPAQQALSRHQLDAARDASHPLASHS